MRATRHPTLNNRLAVLSVFAMVLSLACLVDASRAEARPTDDTNSESAASTPCLQELDAQKSTAPKPDAKDSKPGWFSQHAAPIMGGIGALGGAVVGKALCKPQQRTACMMAGGVGGALLGSQLGKMLSESEKKRYEEASYKAALTGRPQSLTLDKGCMTVDPAPTETFEMRQVDLALGPTVATPQKLRTVAMPYVRPSSASVAADPSPAKSLTKVDANVPLFVMGSTDSGKYFLLGSEDNDQGYIGEGYVDAQGWVASPDSNPAPLSEAGGAPKIVKIGVEVPCRQISSSIRVEASNKQETYPGKVCRLPNGVADSQ